MSDDRKRKLQACSDEGKSDNNPKKLKEEAPVLESDDRIGDVTTDASFDPNNNKRKLQSTEADAGIERVKRVRVADEDAKDIEASEPTPCEHRPSYPYADIPLLHQELGIPWTADQAEVLKCAPALNTDRIIRATAGVGKTTLLIELIMRVLAPPICAKPETILVEAFNQSAALQLRERLRVRVEKSKFFQAAEVEAILAVPTIGCTIHSCSRSANLKYKVIPTNKIHQYALDELPVMLLDDVEKHGTNHPFMKDIQWVFVDEFQDVDPVQHATIQKFREQRSTMVVVIGDIDQNLYSFRNTDASFMMDFASSVPNPPRQVYEFQLRINQRSSIPIVELGYAIVCKNYEKREKEDLCAPQPFISYQSLPSYVGIINRMKPKLALHTNCFKGLGWVARQIVNDIQSRKYLPHEIAILSRNNSLLYRIEAMLRQFGISTWFAKCQEDGASSSREIKHQPLGRVYGGTIHQAKGGEWPCVYGIGYHNEFFPDRREKNIRNERNLHFVLCSRAKKELTLCMDMENPSIFIVEQPLSTYDIVFPVIQSANNNDWPLDWNVDVLTNADDLSPLIPIPSWFIGVTDMLGNLRGQTFMEMKRKQLVPPSIWEFMMKVEGYEDFTTGQMWSEDNDISTIALLRMKAKRAYERPLESTYQAWIRQDMLESEFGYFIDMLARRLVFEFNCKHHHDTCTRSWKDKHVEKFLGNLCKIKKNSLRPDLCNMIELAYRGCQAPGPAWQSLVLPIWRLSWCCSFEKGRSAIAFIPVSEHDLAQYNDLYAKMAIYLEYVVASQGQACQSAWTRRWRLGEDPSQNVHKLFATKYPAFPRHLLSHPCLVGELDLVLDHGIVDFKNFVTNTDYVSVHYILQMLIYVLLLKCGFNEYEGDCTHSKPLTHISIYNILGDRWYYIPLHHWTEERMVAFASFIIEEYYQVWLEHR